MAGSIAGLVPRLADIEHADSQQRRVRQAQVGVAEAQGEQVGAVEVVVVGHLQDAAAQVSLESKATDLHVEVGDEQVVVAVAQRQPQRLGPDPVVG